MIQAGRGWGKTKTGAEDVAWYGLNNPHSRIAVIAPTYADARDTCVEGESGLKNVIPFNCIDAWNRSLGELLLVNGTRYKLFAAEEPDRLRGPQHHRAWCFIAGTLVTTPTRGTVPIEKIRAGDYVRTRIGPCRVINTQNHIAKVGRVRFDNGAELVGTADHLVYLARGWTRLDRLQRGDAACAIDASSGAVNGGIATAAIAAPITSVQTNRLSQNERLGCIKRYGTTLSAPCREVLKSTTRITTNLTTAFQISNAFLSPTIQKYTAKIRQFLKWIGKRLRLLQFTVPIAVQQSYVSGPAGLFADLVSFAAPTNGESQSSSAKYAAKDLKHGLETTVANVASTWLPEGEQYVFCLTVEGQPEYFANGILVHNCDELGAWRYGETWDQMLFGLRLGEHPQVIVTTTPQPNDLVRRVIAGDKTIITRGSTFENAANLAPSALVQLRLKYEGTRMGRQELEGELIEEVEGALWNRAMIEQSRVFHAPDLIRVVVAIDPAATSNESSALTGIVAAGIDVAGRGYILRDVSNRYSPSAWAYAAIKLFDELKADRIVAESNQGGEMVRHTLETARANLPIRMIHASKGKQARAEPISALYEQGRVSHVGTFPELEDQLTTWAPLEGKPSPDRLDAMVWALTDLMVYGSGALPNLTPISIPLPDLQRMW